MNVKRIVIRQTPVKYRHILCSLLCVVGLSGMSEIVGAEASKQGPAKNESSQQVGQQGLGLESGASSPILAGPEIIIGTIKKIQAEAYTIEGEGGQEIRIRVTKDTNKVCPSSDQAKVSSGQEGARERAEIPPTSSMQQQASKKQHESSHVEQRDRKDLEQHAVAPPTRDPSHMQTTIGSTDSRANEDVARGSGFIVGRCAFKVGDHVRVEASDMGTATTIKQLVSAGSKR